MEYRLDERADNQSCDWWEKSYGEYSKPMVIKSWIPKIIVKIANQIKAP